MKHETRKQLLVALILLGCGLCSGCTTAVYWGKGWPAHVALEREAAPAQLAVVLERVSPGAELALLEAQALKTRQTLNYSTIESRTVSSANPLWQLLELIMFLPPFGPILVPVSIRGSLAVAEADPDMKAPAWRNALLAGIAPLSPFHGIFGTETTVEVRYDEPHFTEPPISLDYELRRPLRGQALRYRVVDAAGAVVAQGEGSTDDFGTVQIQRLQPGPLEIEVETAGRTLRYHLQR